MSADICYIIYKLTLWEIIMQRSENEKKRKIKYKHGKDIFIFAYINFIHNASIIVWFSNAKFILLFFMILTS
jgi:hypothetical protein